MTERKRQEMGDKKHKIGGSQAGSNSRPHYSGTHLSSSSKVTSTSISVSTSSNIRGSSLSSSSSTFRATSKEEISTSARTTSHLAFMFYQPTRTIRQRQRKEEDVDVSVVGNKVTG
jgi:hypothetical protein